MIQVADTRCEIGDVLRYANHAIVVDILRLVGNLVVVSVPARREEDDRDAVTRVLLVVATAIDVRGMTVGVHGVIECQRVFLGAVHRFREITQLRG